MLLIGLIVWVGTVYMFPLMMWGPAAIVIATIAQRVVGWGRGRIVTGFATDPFSVENRSYLVQFVLRVGLAGLVVP